MAVPCTSVAATRRLQGHPVIRVRVRVRVRVITILRHSYINLSSPFVKCAEYIAICSFLHNMQRYMYNMSSRYKWGNK